MDSMEVLATLEAELRKLDTQRNELARAIETIRRIIVVGRPETSRPMAAPDAARRAKADLAIDFIQKRGGRATMKDILAAVGDPAKSQQSEYGTVFSALKRRAKKDKRLSQPEPGAWQVS